MSTDSSCSHRKLSFGSGGFYIFCAECGGTWTPEGAHGDDNHKRCISNAVLTGAEEVRTDPKTPAEFFAELEGNTNVMACSPRHLKKEK